MSVIQDFDRQAPSRPLDAPHPPRAGRGARLVAALRSLRAGDVALAGLFVLLATWILIPAAFTGQDPLIGVSAQKLRPPSIDHPFGTDYLGRDLFARVVHGAAPTLLGPALAVPIALAFGALAGLVSAGFRGAADMAVMRVVDILLAIPGFLLALCMVAALGPSTVTLAVAIGIAAIAPFARLTRSEVLRVRELDFVEAAHLAGHGRLRTLVHEILPNAFGPVAALVAIEVSHAILTISALAFLGYGNPPPSPEWGIVIAEGRKYLGSAWWITVLPGAVLIAVALAFAALSRRLQAIGRI